MGRAFLRCINSNCRLQFSLAERLYQCPNCSDLLDIDYHLPQLEVEPLKETFRGRRLSNQPLDRSGVWRFRELLPLEPEDWSLVVTLEEGNTPLLEAPRSADFAGLERLRVKHLGWNPTGSFKDYGMTVAVSQARKLGARAVACASTGNTSASMAAYCARTNLKAFVFIPKGNIAYGKLAQTLDYGATTVQIEGDFDKAMELVRELATETDLYLMNSINPFRLEGQKTAVFELMDQLDWRVPDRIVLPGGNLGNSSAVGKALCELKRWGFIRKVPRLTIIQAAGAGPLFLTLDRQAESLIPVREPFTLASAIKIGNPVNWKKAKRSLEFTDGWCDVVEEEEIAEAKAVLGRDGIGCEPASAAALAGLRKLLRLHHPQLDLDASEDVVVLLTGHQLKDPDYTVKYHLGELQAEARRKGGEPAGAWSNRPLQVPADKGAIRSLLGL